jgi:hypothetical protein
MEINILNIGKSLNQMGNVHQFSIAKVVKLSEESQQNWRILEVFGG